MKTALRAFYAADASIAALAGENVSWGWRLQASPVPALTLITTDGPEDWLLAGGVSGFVLGEVQADCWGSTQADADSLAVAVKRASASIRAINTGGVIQGVFVVHSSDEFEGEKPERLFRVRLALRVPFKHGASSDD